MEKLICDFCGATDSAENPIISGDHASICKSCITTANDIMQGKNVEEANKNTPKKQKTTSKKF